MDLLTARPPTVSVAVAADVFRRPARVPSRRERGFAARKFGWIGFAHAEQGDSVETRFDVPAG